MVNELNRSEFESAIARPGILLVDCQAAWCGSCGGFADVFRRVSEKHPRHRFSQIDTDAEKELRETLGIAHVPSLLIYRDGVLLLKQAGKFDEETLDSMIAQAESLDMNEVRAELDGNDERNDPSAA